MKVRIRLREACGNEVLFYHLVPGIALSLVRDLLAKINRLLVTVEIRLEELP